MMARKRVPLPKARAAKALHPVEAMVEGGSTETGRDLASIENTESWPATERTASMESAESTGTAESSADLEASILSESSTSSQSSELLEIAKALESTAAKASVETAESEENLVVPEGAASTTSKTRPISRYPTPAERVDRAAVEVLQKPPDAPTVGHYRRSFMLDPETLALIDELRWHLRCDKSEVVRRAVDLLAREAGLRGEDSQALPPAT